MSLEIDDKIVYQYDLNAGHGLSELFKNRSQSSRPRAYMGMELKRLRIETERKILSSPDGFDDNQYSLWIGRLQAIDEILAFMSQQRVQCTPEVEIDQLAKMMMNLKSEIGLMSWEIRLNHENISCYATFEFCGEEKTACHGLTRDSFLDAPEIAIGEIYYGLRSIILGATK